MERIDSPQNVNPAYQLNWGFTIFWREHVPDSDWLSLLQSATEHDGVRVLKHRMATNDASQFFVSSKPQVSPAQMIRSVQGCLQYLVLIASQAHFLTVPVSAGIQMIRQA